MYIGLHVRYPAFCPIVMKLEWTDGRTDRHDEANSRFFEILRRNLKTLRGAHTMY